MFFFFFSSRRRHTRLQGDWSSDVCSSDLGSATPHRSQTRPRRRLPSVVGGDVIERLKIGSIVIRCFEFDRMFAFWRDALHYVATRPPDNGWVILRDPQGSGPNLSLDQSPERRSGKRSRLHLDLYTK